jgi:hypothetical protein
MRCRDSPGAFEFAKRLECASLLMLWMVQRTERVGTGLYGLVGAAGSGKVGPATGWWPGAGRVQAPEVPGGAGQLLELGFRNGAPLLQ